MPPSAQEPMEIEHSGEYEHMASESHKSEPPELSELDSVDTEILKLNVI